MRDRDAVLRAILEYPADDLPRLAYADLCEEQGDAARAEFIRVQLELAGLPGCQFITLGQQKPCFETARPTSISCRRCVLWLRERDILIGAGLSWYDWNGEAIDGAMGDCRPQGYIDAGVWANNAGTRGFRYRRGFIASIRCDSRDFIRHAGAIFAEHPVERVMLTDRRPANIGGYPGWQNSEWPVKNWLRSTRAIYRHPHWLPLEIGRSMPTMGRFTLAAYADEQAAHAALSDACVAWGRERAGMGTRAKAEAADVASVGENR